MGNIAIVGTGFVADLYMRSLKTFPWITVVKAYDNDKPRLATFCNYWKVPSANSLSELLDNGPNAVDLILNLTNPDAHFEVSRLCLEAGMHVYSEKPLATEWQTLLRCRLGAEEGRHARLCALQRAWRGRPDALASFTPKRDR